MRLFLLMVIALLSYCSSYGADFYVDPVNGSMNNDGSQAHPWSTMQAVWEGNKIKTKTATGVEKNPSGVVNAGDTIYLMSGYHGKLTINVAHNDSPITIKSFTGQTPEFCQIYLSTVKNWVFDGLSVSPSHTTPFVRATVFYLEDHSFFGPTSDIIIRNCEIFCTTNLHMATKEDWAIYASAGIQALAPVFGDGPNNITIENNHIYNISSGVALTGSDCIVRNNHINYFNRSGVFIGVGDRNLIEYNLITNQIYLDDGAHCDIIQGMEQDEDTLDDLIIRGNTMIARQDLGLSLPTSTIGIGMHDGFFKRMLIENNVLILHTTSAIIINGAIDCTIINNTIAPPTTGGAATVAIFPHKDARVGYGNVVRNNFFTGVSVNTGGGVEDHNIVIGGGSSNFVDVYAYDYRLKQNSEAIGVGSTILAPSIDLTERSREIPTSIGAYEYAGGFSLGSTILGR